MTYPMHPYGKNRFGLFPLDHDLVEYRCQMVLDRLQMAKKFGDQNRIAIKAHIEWDVDRCLYDDPETQQHDKLKRSFAHHWHTAEAWKAHQNNLGKEIHCEHVVPRKVIEQDLSDAFGSGKIKTWQDVRNRLAPSRIIVLITRDEHRALRNDAMPEGVRWEPGTTDPWLRYQEIGLEILPPQVKAPRQNAVGRQESASWGQRQKLEAVDQLEPLPKGFVRVGGAEDRNAGGRDGNLTDSIVPVAWLEAPRGRQQSPTSQNGFATGLPAVIAVSSDNGVDVTVYVLTNRDGHLTPRRQMLRGACTVTFGPEWREQFSEALVRLEPELQKITTDIRSLPHT